MVLPGGPEIALCFPHMLVLFVLPYLSRALKLHHVHCCHATLLWTVALSTDVVTTGSLAHLQV